MSERLADPRVDASKVRGIFIVVIFFVAVTFWSCRITFSMSEGGEEKGEKGGLVADKLRFVLFTIKSIW